MHANPGSTPTSPARTAILAAAFALLLSCPAFGQTDIVVSPDPLWSPSFGVADLSGAAGTDFGTLSSAASQVDIDIPTLTVANARWIVYVGKTDVFWNGSLSLWIARTGNGSGPGGGQISGPLNTFIQIPNVTFPGPPYGTELYRGRRWRIDVPAQLQIQGLSVALGAATFTTTVTFTVTEY
jgi:hypothetical protein